MGVEVDAQGGILFSDLENMVVRRIDPDGQLSTIAGATNESEELLHSAPALNFPMNRPSGLAWTPTGDLLIAERSGHRVLQLNGLADDL